MNLNHNSSNLHAQRKSKPQFTHKNQIHFTRCIYIHEHPIQTNIYKYAKFLKYITRLHTTVFFKVEFIYSPKYIKKYGKWSIEFKNIHATTNNKISKSLPILGIYSLITPFTPPLSSIPCLYLEYSEAGPPRKLVNL